MNEKITPELMEKAKTAGSPEELLTLAKESGVTLTAEEAQGYYDQLHKTGELADDELDAVAGGSGCDNPGYRPYKKETDTCQYFLRKDCGECGPHEHSKESVICKYCKYYGQETHRTGRCNNEANLQGKGSS